jgi:hypothetical protein
MKVLLELLHLFADIWCGGVKNFGGRAETLLL